MFIKVNSIGLFGLNAYSVEVELAINRGQPSFDLVGLPDASIKESRENKVGFTFYKYSFSCS